MQQCDESRQTRLRNLAIALPICLFSLSVVFALTFHLNRRRIVRHLYHKYNGLDCDTRPYHPNTDTKDWSNPTFSPELSAFPNCILPDVSTSPSTMPDPYRTLSRQGSTRALGTPNFPGPRQQLASGRQCSTEQLHSSEKSYTAAHRPRCLTPETPLSRKDQLAHRSQLIQDTHIRRLGSISPEPPLIESAEHSVAGALQNLTSGSATLPGEAANGGGDAEHDAAKAKDRPVSFSRPLSKSSRPTSPYARPTSPTGSIRLVDTHLKDMELPRRVTSDAIGSRLEEVFMPEWLPEAEKRNISPP